MTAENTQMCYELVFKGPKDNSDDTLRKIKGVFLSDLDLSVSEAQEILSKLPATIKTSSNEEDLKPFYDALKNAGANIYIVKPAEDSEEVPVADSDLGLEVKEENSSETSEDSFWLDDGSDKSDNLVEEPEPERSFTLDFTFDDEEEDSSEANKVPEAQQAEPDGALDFSLSLDETPHSPEVEKAPEATLSMDAEGVNTLDLADIEPEKPKEEAPAPQGVDISFLQFDEEEETSSTESIDTKAAEAPKEEAPVDTIPGLSLDENASEEASEEPPAPPVQEESPKEPVASTDLKMDEEAPQVTLSTDEASPTVASEEPKTEELSSVETTPPVGKMKKKPNTEEPKEEKETAEDEVYEVKLAEGSYTKPKAKSNIPFDLIILLVVGLGALVAFNLYILNNSAEEINISELDIEAAISAAAPPMAKEKSKKTKKEAKAVEKDPLFSGELNGHTEDSEKEIKWNFSLIEGKLDNASLVAMMPPPPALTPEEIVNDKQQRPWIRKIEADFFQFNETEGGMFEAESPGRAYVEYEGKRRRLPTNSSIIVRVNPDGSSLKGTFSAWYGFDAAPPAQANSLSHIEGKGFELYFSGALSYKKDVEASDTLADNEVKIE